MDRQRVISSLDALSKRDKKRALPGAKAHEYRLNAPLALTEIERFENENGIHLPDDYRLFITEIGNGGAGPYYGLFAFGYQDDGYSYCKWEDGYLVGDLAKQFPHEDSWNLPESFWAQEPNPSDSLSQEEVNRLYEDWHAKVEADYWDSAIMDGAIPICHKGCALRQWLVINGDHKGEIWADNRADEGGIHPLRDKSGQRIGFDQWYSNWLDEALQQFRITQSMLDRKAGWWTRLTAILRCSLGK